MSMRARHALIGIVATAIVIRLALFVVLLADDNPEHFILADTRGYMLVTDSLLSGHGFSQSTTTPYLPDSMRTPVLPLILAATKGLFGSPVPYILVQIGLAAALIYATFRLAHAVTESGRLALAAAALMAFEPYAIFINLSLLTETIFALMITGAAYALVLYVKGGSWKPVALASGLIACAALTRPIAQFAPVLIAMLVLWREPVRTYPRYLAAVFVPFLIVIGPWVIRNYMTFGITAISSGGLQNVYSDLGATILVYDEGGVWREKKNWLEADFATRHGIPVSTIQQNLELSPILFSEGLGLMVAHPVGTAKSFLSVALAFLTSDVWSYYPQKWGWLEPFTLGFSPTQSLLTDGPFATVGRVLNASGGVGLLIAIAGRIFWIIMNVLFAAGLWLLWREGGVKRSYAIMIAVSVLYYLGLSWSTGAGVNGRYRYPLDPLIFTAAVVGAAAVASRVRDMLGWRKAV